MKRDRLQALLNEFRQKRILVLGDIMLDRFLWGNVSRISPEAPVPVVHVQRESQYPGGAANVARNLAPFTPNISLVGLAGADDFGKMLLDTLETSGIGSEGIVIDDAFQTIVKTRIVARQQQVVRVDRERPASLTSKQETQIVGYLERAVPACDAIILEDYGKGLLQQPLVEAATRLAQQNGVPVTADPNPNNRLDWNGVTVLKPNRLEAFRMAGIPEPESHPNPLEDQPLLEAGAALLRKWDTRMLLITLSQHGMLLFRREGPPVHVPAKAREVYDVSGAGDTAIALLTLALAAGSSPVEAVEISNYASATVVGKLGTATLTPDELLASLP